MIAAALLVAGPTASLALTEKEAARVNRDLFAMRLDANFAHSKVLEAQAQPDQARACAKLREAKTYMDEGAREAQEILDVIGPDLFGEFRDNRNAAKAALTLKADIDAALASCS